MNKRVSSKQIRAEQEVAGGFAGPKINVFCLFFLCFLCEFNLSDSLYHGGSNWSTGVAAPLVALHVAPYAEGLAAASVGAAERLLAGVAVRVDAKAGRSGEGLVAGAADVSVVVLLERPGGGGREVVVMLPGIGDLRDHLLGRGRRQRSSLRGRALVGPRRSGSLVVHGGRGRRFDGRGVGSHAGSGRDVRSTGNVLNGALARDRGPVRRAGQGHLLLRVGFRLDGGADGRDRRGGRRVTVAVEAGAGSQWRSRGHVGLRSAGSELADFGLRADFGLAVQWRGSSLAL